MATQSSNRIDKTQAKTPSLACETCRKKKIKCSGRPAPCSGCVQSKVNCVFTTEIKLRKTPVRSARRIDGLEGRLTRIESLLEGTTAQSRSNSSPTSSDSSTAKPIEPLSDVISRIEASDAYKTQSATAADNSLDSSNSDQAGPLSKSGNEVTSKVTYPLPPLDQMLESVEKFFNTTNRFIPFTDEDALVAEVKSRYSTLSSGGSSLWAFVNVLLAYSHQLGSDETSGKLEHNAMAKCFLENAISSIDKISSQHPTMRGAQTLVGIAKLLLGTPNQSAAHVASSYIALAIRQIYQLGLHKKNQPGDLSDLDIEWRRRLLWIIYSVDSHLCLRLDQPPSLRDDDIETDLPDWNPRDGLGFIPHNGGLSINYLRLDVDLARLQSKIYARLYSLKACRQVRSEAGNAETACKLALELLAWKNQIPGVDNFNPITLTQDFPQSSVIAMAMLYLRYFNSMTLVHRLAFFRVDHLEVYKSSFGDLATNPCPTQVMCVEGARVALHLFAILPHGNVPCMWRSVDYFISAAVILLAGIIYNAEFNQGAEDLRLIEPVLVNLHFLSQHGDAEKLKHIWASCHDLEAAARNLIDERGNHQAQSVYEDGIDQDEVNYDDFDGLLDDSYQEFESFMNDSELISANTILE